MWNLLRLKLMYLWFLICYKSKCKKLPRNPYIDGKNGLWRTTRSDLGLLLGNTLLVGPVYYPHTTYQNYHTLNYKDIQAYIDYSVRNGYASP